MTDGKRPQNTAGNNPFSTMADTLGRILDIKVTPPPAYVPGSEPGTSVQTYEWRMWFLTQVGVSEKEANYLLSLSCPDEAIRERASQAYAEMAIDDDPDIAHPDIVGKPSAIM